MISENALSHIRMKNELYKQLPQLKNYQGPYYPSLLYITILCLLQWSIGYIIYKYDLNILVIGLISFINCNTLYYSLTTFIHENAHNLVVKRKYSWMVTILLEYGLLTFGQHHLYEIVHPREHHSKLNDQRYDSECPYLGHISNNDRVYKWLECLPIVSLVRSEFSPKKKFNIHKTSKNFILFMTIMTLIVHLCLIFNGMYKISLFFLVDTKFISKSVVYYEKRSKYK